MARPLRIESPGAFYHVMHRGNDDTDIFKSNRDREKFLEYVGKAVERYDIKIHVPEPYFQLTRMYGWYWNRMRGDRKKQEEREKETAERESETIEDSIDVRNYKPKRIPQLMWRECIEKVWEVDPLTFPKCTGEMRIINFIYKKTVIKR